MFEVPVQYPGSAGAIGRWLTGSGNKRSRVVLVTQMKPLLSCSTGACRLFISDLEVGVNSEQKKLTSGVS